MKNGKPVLTADDSTELTDLLAIFDNVTFNNDNEMVARFKATFPLLGELVVSYYARGQHLQVYQEFNDRVVLNTAIDHPGSREALLVTVQALLNKEWNDASK